MQITQTEKSGRATFVVAAWTVATYLLFTWSPWLTAGLLFLALLVFLAQFCDADASATHSHAASGFDELFPDEPAAALSIYSPAMLRPNDLFLFGDGLLGSDSWDDDGCSHRV